MTNTLAEQPTKIVGGNVRAELARANRSQTWLGCQLGLPQSSVSDRMNGRTPFDINELARIAGLLCIPIGRLIDGVEVVS